MTFHHPSGFWVRRCLFICLIGLVVGCDEGKSARRVCRSHQTEVWNAAASYYLEHGMKPDDLIDPQQLAALLPNGQVPRCPIGTNAYAPFKIFDGPKCPYEAQLHAGATMPASIAKLKTRSP
jgi:hypothetical protein